MVEFSTTQFNQQRYKNGFRDSPNYFYNVQYGFGRFNRDYYHLNAEFRIKNTYKISYAYETSISKLNNGVVGDSHEIGLSLCIP